MTAIDSFVKGWHGIEVVELPTHEGFYAVYDNKLKEDELQVFACTVEVADKHASKHPVQIPLAQYQMGLRLVNDTPIPVLLVAQFQDMLGFARWQNLQPTFAISKDLQAVVNISPFKFAPKR